MPLIKVDLGGETEINDEKIKQIRDVYKFSFPHLVFKNGTDHTRLKHLPEKPLTFENQK